VTRHIFQACPVCIYTQSNITNIICVVPSGIASSVFSAFDYKKGLLEIGPNSNWNSNRIFAWIHQSFTFHSKCKSFRSRPYAHSKSSLTLNEWRFNLSFSWVSMLFLNSWRVSSHIVRTVRCPSRFGPPSKWIPRSKSASEYGPGSPYPLANMDLYGGLYSLADLDSPREFGPLAYFVIATYRILNIVLKAF
jgi:hypothetical protein